MSSAICCSLDQSKILSSGNGSRIPSKSSVNSLPNDKILDWSKLEGFADDKINVTEK